jgi:hypothetical protein
METKTDYKRLRKYAKNLKEKQVRRKNTQRLNNNKIKNLKLVKKTAKYRNRKTLKGGSSFETAKNTSLKKRGFDRDFDDKFGDSKDINIGLEHLIDSIDGGFLSLFGPSCGVPKIKKIEKKLNKLKHTKLSKVIGNLRKSAGNLSFTLDELKLNFSKHMNVKRILFNLEQHKGEGFEGVNKYKLENLKTEHDQKGYNEAIILQNIDTLEKSLVKKLAVYDKVKVKFDKIYKEYKKQYDKVVGKGKDKGVLKKMADVMLKYKEYIYKKNNLSDSQDEDVKKELKKGAKCEKKWKIVETFYKDKFEAKDEILNHALGLLSQNKQLTDFIKKELSKYKTDIKGTEWSNKTTKIYDVFKNLLKDDKTVKESLKYKSDIVKGIIKNVERIIDIIKQTSNPQLDKIIKCLEVLLKFTNDVKKNFGYITTEINEIFVGLLELQDYVYLKKKLSNIISLHFQNVHKLLLLTFYLENINKQDQFNVYTQIILGRELKEETAINYTRGLNRQVDPASVNVATPGTQVYRPLVGGGIEQIGGAPDYYSEFEDISYNADQILINSVTYDYIKKLHPPT